MLLYTYATQRPIGARARSLHVGTPAHVYTVHGHQINNSRARRSLYYTNRPNKDLLHFTPALRILSKSERISL